MCQADVQPVLPDVAGMLSEISQDGKWPLSEKLFNYVFRHVLPLVEPQHIDSGDMKDLNASDLQIVRMLNNALRQSGVHAPTASKSVNIHSTSTDGPGHFRGYSEGGSMLRTSLFAQSGSNSSGSIANGTAGTVPIAPSTLRPIHGQDGIGVDEVTSSLSNLSFDRPRSSDTTGTSRTDSRGDASDVNARVPTIDSALEAILQQAATVAARDTQPGPPPPELACCNELLSVYLRCGQQQRAMELLRRMLAYANLSPMYLRMLIELVYSVVLYCDAFILYIDNSVVLAELAGHSLPGWKHANVHSRWCTDSCSCFPGLQHSCRHYVQRSQCRLTSVLWCEAQ